MLQYERILGKAALGRGPAEHWAHADYGWLLYQEGDIQGARQHLEDALRVATSSGCIVTDSQVGSGFSRLYAWLACGFKSGGAMEGMLSFTAPQPTVCAC